MKKPGPTAQVMVELWVKARKARNITGVQQGALYVAPLALLDLPALYLGRCPRLLHYAPLVLNRRILADERF